MNIAFCINNFYVQYICVTLKSISESNSVNNLTIHIVSDFISAKNRIRIQDVLSIYKNINYKIHIIDPSLIKGLDGQRWTPYSWYRILLPQILPEVETVLYLDADTLVVSDLSPLFKLDISKYAVAGCIDDITFIESDKRRLGYDMNRPYVNSGVLFMNLNYWRKHNLTVKIRDWAIRNKNILHYPDQDAINVICQDSICVLPLKYNVVYYYFKLKIYFERFREQLRECIENPVIIHYGNCYPWFKDTDFHLFSDKWHKYNKMLPVRAKIGYREKLLIRLKIFIWNMVHRERNKNSINLEKIKALIYAQS